MQIDKQNLKNIFLDIGLQASFVNTLLNNKEASAVLHSVILRAGLKTANKKVGAMLMSVATKLNASCVKHRDMLAELVGNGSINNPTQMDYVIQYLKGVQSRHQQLDKKKFQEDCGLGKVLDVKAITVIIQQNLADKLEQLKTLRYKFDKMAQIAEVKKKIPYANGKDVMDAFNSYIESVLGPKNEKDLQLQKKPQKKKDEKKKQEKKQQAKQEKKGVNIIDLIPRDMEASLNTKELVQARNQLFGDIILTRFPPQPNGYLHIGHAKAIKFNFQTAKRNSGKCYLRFDDTNPDKENMQFINMIQENIKFLGFQPWKITYSSDNFDKIYDLAVQIIRKGHAFVCHQPVDIQRKKRSECQPSQFRDRPIEENLALFKDMRDGKFKEHQACLRAKIDFKHPNTTLRDPVIYRIKFKPHPHTGEKWCIYPMYDFTHPICDSLQGISHSLCTLQFQIRRELYYWPLQLLNMYRPFVWEYSRLNITNTVLSKRKIQTLVNCGLVEGWNDPRLLTIEGMRRRGYSAEAILAFCEQISVTRRSNQNTIEFDLLEHFVKKDLDQRAPRTFAVIEPAFLTLTNLAEQRNIECPNFPKNKERGSHSLRLTSRLLIEREDVRLEDKKDFFGIAPGKLVGLKYVGVIKVLQVSAKGETFDVKAELTEGKPKSYIHWLSEVDSQPAQFRLYESLFTVANPGQAQDVVKVVNPKSLTIKKGFCAKQVGQRHQFERLGYFIREKGDGLIFNRTTTLGQAKIQ